MRAALTPRPRAGAGKSSACVAAAVDANNFAQVCLNVANARPSGKRCESALTYHLIHVVFWLQRKATGSHSGERSRHPPHRVVQVMGDTHVGHRVVMVMSVVYAQGRECATRHRYVYMATPCHPRRRWVMERWKHLWNTALRERYSWVGGTLDHTSLS